MKYKFFKKVFKIPFPESKALRENWERNVHN